MAINLAYSRDLSKIIERSDSSEDDDNPKPHTPYLDLNAPKQKKKKKTMFKKSSKVDPVEHHTPPVTRETERTANVAPPRSILKPSTSNGHNIAQDHLSRYAPAMDLPKGQDGNNTDESGMYSGYESDLEGGRRIQLAIANSTVDEHDNNIKMNMDDLIKPDMAVPEVKENKLPTHICKVFFDATDGIFKIVFAAVLLMVILTCLITSEGCLLFIAHQMNLYVSFKRVGYRPEDVVDLEWVESLDNDTILQDKDQSCSIPQCKHIGGVDGTNCAQVEAVRWIWAMFMCQCLEYFTTFCRSFWKICFKKKLKPSFSVVLWTILAESLSTLGTFMMLHMLLPKWDVTRGLFIISAVAFVPSLLNGFNNPSNKSTATKVIDILATVIQGSALFVWLITSGVDEIPLGDRGGNSTMQGLCGINISTMSFESDYNGAFSSGLSTGAPAPAPPYSYLLPKDHQLPESVEDIWCLPLALLFISLGYWQNFIDRYTKKLGKFGGFLISLRKEHARSKTKVNLILGPYRIALTLVLMALYYELQTDMDIHGLFSSTHFYNNEETCGDQADGPFHSDWLSVVGIAMAATVVCLYAADLAIQAKLQIFSFTVPLVIATPVTYLVFMVACTGCGDWDFGTDFYWNCFSGHDGYNETLAWTYGYLGFFWWISLLWIARHLWTPGLERLAMLDKIFIQPFPSLVFLEQSLMLTRRRNDQEVQKPKHNPKTETRKKSIQNASLNASKVPTMTPDKLGIPFIYMCATMWHETQDEMITMLISIFRMNIDQCARYAEKYIHNLDEPDYYEFEVDIYFDDAFTRDPQNPELMEINDFVKDFLESMDKAASVAYNVGIILTPPTKYETPYGGRMEWKLPLTENKIVLHLKDKKKIRNKKRWSQVMYMKSLIGRGIESQKAEPIVKDYVARNTFILALDGDIDFKPEAVLHLVDLMKRDPKVAAACGRIHPTGSGPMVWYQKFEYSISHWLQKSTEHVFGCVLCSPGCFSLFRASAMIDDKIPDIYATVAKDPINFVQYDQGEDRWLCTLLIQKGHRIEYSAAADAFTNAPEEFNEFFNQRRRWITSTFANLLDIIGNGVKIAKDNESVSLLYMFYQLVLFISSIIGPATIFLLICGSFELVFGLDAFFAAVLGIVPVIIFMILCYKTKTTTQLAYASVLTVIYAVMQMVVLAGMLRVMVEEGLCGSSTIFFLFIVGVFVLAALVHPFEMSNILHSFIFYLFIPSVYLLLIVYSLCNVNQITWGTRETKTPGQHVKQKKKTGFKKWASYMGIETNNDEDEDEDGCCDSLVCCTHRQTDERLTNIEAQMMVLTDQNRSKPGKPTSTTTTTKTTSPRGHQVPSVSVTVSTSEAAGAYKGPWIDDPRLGKGDVYSISHEETKFWRSLIETTLPPEVPHSAEQQKIKEGLNELRNKAVFSFFIVDMLMIAFILALKMSADYGMEDGIMITYTCSFDDGKEHSLDPIGLSFIVVFGLLMVVQVIGMLLHRVFTFLQYISTVLLCHSSKITPNLNEDSMAKRKMSYKFALEMNRFDNEMEQAGDDETNKQEWDTGSQQSLKEDDVLQKSRVSKRRESYTQDQLEKMNSARQKALDRIIKNPQKAAISDGRRGSKRKESIFQPVVDSIRLRKSVIAAPDVEVIQRDEEALINKEKKVVVKILEPPQKKK